MPGVDADRRLGDVTERCNPPDLIAAIELGEPEVAIGSDRDVVRLRAGADAVTELGNDLRAPPKAGKVSVSAEPTKMRGKVSWTTASPRGCVVGFAAR